jgi:hypothetical protein
VFSPSIEEFFNTLANYIIERYLQKETSLPVSISDQNKIVPKKQLSIQTNASFFHQVARFGMRKMQKGALHHPL